jgi:vancomycin resistance protein YoaR
VLVGDFVLTDGTRTMKLTAAQLGPALRAVPDGKGGLRLSVDPPTLTKTVKTAATPLGQSAKAARVKSPSPGVLLTAKGDATYEPRPVKTTVSGGRTGYQVDVGATVKSIDAAVASGRRDAALPGKVTPIPTKNGDLAAVNQVIGSFTTYFPCCQPRVKNINRMAEIVDGTVVAPGETFSLNGIVGRRTLEGGFVEDHAIVGDRLEEQVGGGVSQFSTTLLNAVWFAGLPSLQHQPHTAYISRYPAVREATLDFGNIDNLWRNTTSHPIVVRTHADGGSVTVALYGHTGDREVTSVTSKRTPTKGGGFKATVSRTVRDGGKVTKQDGLAWTYRGPLKTEAEIKKEEAAKKKAAEAKKKADAAKAKATPSPTATPRR